MADVSVVEEIHEMDEADEFTRDGTVDRKGRRAIKAKTGGWSVAVLVLLNQALVTLALSGVGVNLVVFMTKVLGQDNAKAANNVSNWTGTTYIFSLVGAFSDSYCGRYNSSAFFQLIFVTGLIELSLSSYFMVFKHCTPGLDHPQCKSPTNLAIKIFYLSIYQIALGNGAYQPSITTFGADQFDEDDPKEQASKVAFFSYFFVANNIGTLFSNTAVVYLEDKGKWVLGFGLSSGAALLALVLFLAGTPRFRHFKAHGNPLSRVCQVIVAATKKRKVVMPHNAEHLYEVEGKNAFNGGRKILHTPDFKFLDRAAAATPEDLSTTQDHQHPPSQWKLCTITQVEEVKCILRLLPIWLCTIMYAVAYNQMGSVFVEQAAAMNTSISSFSVPPASMSIFEILSVSGFVVIYRLFIVPFVAMLRKDPEGLTELQRMGIGLVIAAFSMVSAGIVEYQRKMHAKHDCDDCERTSSLSIMWQIPQYVLMGVSEVFMLVGQLEFFNCQAPDGLKSFGSALFAASMALGGYFSSLIVTVVMKITASGNQAGWIPDDLNNGHMDKFYFLLAALVTIDLAIFVACAKLYRSIKLEGRSNSSEITPVNERERAIEL